MASNYQKSSIYYKGKNKMTVTNNLDDTAVLDANSVPEQLAETPTEPLKELSPALVTSPSDTVTTTQVVEENDRQQKTTNLPEGFSPVYKIELDLNTYSESMDVKNHIDPEEGGKLQYFLFKVIKGIFSAKSQEEFNAEFNTVLAFFNKNKTGIFNEKFIYRFPENWPGSQKEFDVNRRLIYAIIQTADRATRKKNTESINLEKTVEGMTEQQKQLLFNFYS